MPTIFRSFATSSAIPPSLRDWAKALHSFFFSMLDPQLFIFLSENCFSSPVSTCPGRRTQVSELSRSHFRDHLRLVCCFLFRVFVFMRLPPVLSARGHPHPTSDSTRPGPFHSSWLPLADCSLTDGQRLLVGGPPFLRLIDACKVIPFSAVIKLLSGHHGAIKNISSCHRRGLAGVGHLFEEIRTQRRFSTLVDLDNLVDAVCSNLPSLVE